VGQGSYGVVVGGTDLYTNKPVVVKFSTNLLTTNTEYECLKAIEEKSVDNNNIPKALARG